MDLREELDSAERAVQWRAWPEVRDYGPGLTGQEVAERHNAFLRSGYSRSGSGAYHNIRVAPLAIPPGEWIRHYPGTVPAVDPWHRHLGTARREIVQCAPERIE